MEKRNPEYDIAAAFIDEIFPLIQRAADRHGVSRPLVASALRCVADAYTLADVPLFGNDR